MSFYHDNCIGRVAIPFSLWGLTLVALAGGCTSGATSPTVATSSTVASTSSADTPAPEASEPEVVLEKIHKTEEQWKETLTPLQYDVTRRKGTEPPFSNEYWDNKSEGVYGCVCCGLSLFDSDAKYESGTGWPSFYKPIEKRHLLLEDDSTLFTVRTEVLCRRCGAHLGHVFDDGPEPTGLRYCMNSAAMKFNPTNDQPQDQK